MTTSVAMLLPAPGRFSIDERLAKPLRQPLTDQARDNVGHAPSGKPTITRTGRVG